MGEARLAAIVKEHPHISGLTQEKVTFVIGAGGGCQTGLGSSDVLR